MMGVMGNESVFMVVGHGGPPSPGNYENLDGHRFTWGYRMHGAAPHGRQAIFPLMFQGLFKHFMVALIGIAGYSFT